VVRDRSGISRSAGTFASGGATVPGVTFEAKSRFLEAKMDERHDFDVIVIGAGPGGLTAAAYLSLTGRRVLVVDARDDVGGHMSAFNRSGYEFDIGLHYASEPFVQEVIRPVGVDVTFREFDPRAMFRLLGPEGAIAVPKGMGAFRAVLHEAFPAERHVADAFLDTAQMLSGELEQIPQHPHLRELPRLPWQLRGLLRYGGTTAGSYLDSLHASRQLKAALLGWTSGSLGLSPSQLSLPIAGRMVEHYLGGLSYPQGGSRAITEGLADVVRKHAGQVRLGAEVTRIVVHGGRVRGVQLRGASLDGPPDPVDEVAAPTVVSAIDLKHTYLGLLPPDLVPRRLARRVRNFELPLPFAVVYMVIDRDLAAEGYSNTTQIVTDGDDIDAMYATLRAGELPESYSAGVWIASLADPANERLCPPGMTNLQLMGVAPARHEFWGIAPGSGSTARYAARKQQVRDALVRLAERAIPGVTESIVHESTSTPVTFERHMRTTEGVSYGPAFTPRQTLSRLGPAGPIEGLFHAGAGVRSPARRSRSS
jgi:phytoene dehydrogenase-like protein